MAQVLLQLAKLITEAAEKIDAECKTRNAVFPSLDEPFTPASEEIRDEPAVASASAVLAAAAEQIMLTAWSPPRSLFDGAFGFHTSSAIRTAGAANVAEALREAGPKGLHVDDIVKGTVVDPAKLGRLMRLLASRHIFREVAPDVFANNRISSLMDTGKSLTELRAHPERKYDGTSGLLALMECTLDEYFKASSYLTETMLDPATASSDSTTQAAMNIALKFDDDYWTFIDRPEQAYRLRRFGVAMQGARVMMPEIHIVDGFPWKEFPQDSVIIDVGGGTGHVSMVLYQHFPHLKLVVQDRHQTIDHAKEWWGTQNPKAIESGRVELQGHDFFKPQPPRTPPALIMLRFILHDWADSYAIQILRNMREIAGPGTRLMIIERLIPYACKTDDKSLSIPGAKDETNAPEPLLPNLGIVSLNGYLADVQMLAAFNGQERTILQFDKIFTAAGWKLDRVYRTPASFATQIIGLPV